MRDENAIAIVGMACRFPAAEDVNQYWANLRGGVDGIRRLDRAELIAAGVRPDLARRAEYVGAYGMLAGADRFDWSFFGYSPAEAAAIDPQQRLFLECASQAIDDAAIDPARFRGWIGVFGGCDPSPVRLGGDDSGVSAAAAVIGQDKDFLATRVAYKLGLRGPAVTVQSACSTALTAVHLASQSLLGYECDAALAGGVSALLPQAHGYLYEEGSILSRDGYCRPFDADASGTVAGSGVGVVALRRFTDAIENGDRVIAVIRGSAINNDGGEKIGYTAPSVSGQRDVIRLALEQAGVNPAEVGYVEAHGTGTPVGDPVEVAALTDAFRESARRDGRCLLGSVKSGIGHVGAAAGVAGLIKTALMLQHRELVPTLHYRRPNPQIDLAATPFEICTGQQPWPAGRPLIAGVSSFGIGGTNVHVVLSGPPSSHRAPEQPAPRLLCLSAASSTAIDQFTDSLASLLDGPNTPRLDDSALTLAARRRFPYRRTVVASDREHAVRELRSPRPAVGSRTALTLGYLFPGQGSLQAGGGRAAYRLLPGFRTVFDELGAEVLERFGVDLAPVVGDGGSPGWSVDTAHQQLGLFVLGYALARQLETWDIRPATMIGNSIGEYIAATLAGVWTLGDALTLVHERAKAMRAAPPGRMVSVAMPADRVAALLGDRLSGSGVVIAVDGPGQAVLAGPVAAVDALRADASLAGTDCRVLDTALAFHSPLMRQAAETVRKTAARLSASPAGLRFVSNLTGGWADPNQVRDPGYWGEHLVGRVRLDEGLATALDGSCEVFIELGPGSSMTSSLRRHRHWRSEYSAVPLLRGDTAQQEQNLLAALGTLWELGLNLPVEEALAGAARVCALPPHPLARTALPSRDRARYRAPGAPSPVFPVTGQPPSGLTRSAWTQGEPAPPVTCDAVLLLGAGPDPAMAELTARLLGGADDDSPVHRALGEPRAGWVRDQMVVAIGEFGRRDAAAPVVLAMLPERIDPGVIADAKAVLAAAADARVRVLLAGRRLFDVLGGEETAPGAELLASWLDVIEVLPEAAAVTVLDIDGSGVPSSPLPAAAEGGVLAWRGRRWWARTSQPVPPTDDFPAVPPRTAVITAGISDGTGVASRLAAAGLRVGCHVNVDSPPVSGDLADTVAQALDATAGKRAESPVAVPLSQRPDLLALLDTFCTGLIGQFALKSSALSPGSVITANALRIRLDPHGILPRFADYMISVLTRARWLTELGGGSLLIHEDLPGLVDRALCTRADLDELAGLRGLLEHCADAYPAVFAGERDRVSVLNPDGNPTMMREGLSGNKVDPSGDVALCIAAVCRAVRAMHARRDGLPLRVLEVGAGNGELTWPLLAGWGDREKVAYQFTDVSPLMLRKAQAEAERRGFEYMRFSLFDLTADPVAQGLAAGTFDLILAYNAVHVAPQVRAALRQLSTLLAPGGSLCLIETTGIAGWAHILWGLTPGWWDYGEDRSEAINVDLATWRKLLQETGLTGVAVLPPDDGADHAVLLASAPAGSGGIAGAGAELLRQTEITPCEDLLYLAAPAAGSEFPAGPYEWWAQLRQQPEIASVRRAWVVTKDQAADVASWPVEAARRTLDPPPAPADQAWRHVRVADLGEAELGALPAVLSRAVMPAVTRLSPASPVPPGLLVPGPAESGQWAPAQPGPGAVGTIPPAGNGPAIPGTLRTVLTELWCEVLGVRSADEGDDFFALGGESLMAVHFMGQIRQRTGISIPVAAFTSNATFGGLVEIARTVSTGGAAGESDGRGAGGPLGGAVPELVTFAGSGARTPLFLAAPAIGTTLAYGSFATKLGDDRPVLGIEAPAADSASARTRLREVAAHHVEVIRRVRPHGPYLLGGWSFGAVVAHEMARQLTELGEEVPAVVCIDGYVPNTTGRPMRDIPGYISAGLWYQIQAAVGLGAMRDIVRGAPGIRKVFNSSIRAIWQYRPVPVPCTVILLKTRLNNRSQQWLRAALAPMYSRGVLIRPVSGTHWTVLDEQYSADLAREIRQILMRLEDPQNPILPASRDTPDGWRPVRTSWPKNI